MSVDLRDVALAGVELGRDGQVAELGEPAAEVLDVLVDAEDLLHHQDDRERPPARGHRPVGGDLAVGDRDLDLAGLEPVVSVVIVWAETGCTARAKPAARVVTTNARRERAAGPTRLRSSASNAVMADPFVLLEAEQTGALGLTRRRVEVSPSRGRPNIWLV